jgi:hypothetical protein
MNEVIYTFATLIAFNTILILLITYRLNANDLLFTIKLYLQA